MVQNRNKVLKGAHANYNKQAHANQNHLELAITVEYLETGLQRHTVVEGSDDYGGHLSIHIVQHFLEVIVQSHELLYEFLKTHTHTHTHVRTHVRTHIHTHTHTHTHTHRVSKQLILRALHLMWKK